MNTPAPRPSAARLALSVVTACALASCASNKGGESSDEKENLYDHFTGNFDFDPKSGRMVATDGNRFRTGDFETGSNDAFRTEAFRSEAFGTEPFRGPDAFRKTDFATEAHDTSRSPLEGKSARAGDKRAFLGENKVATPDVPVNPYREASKIMDADGYRTAEKAQTGDNKVDSDILNPGGDGGDMNVKDVRRLLNKGG